MSRAPAARRELSRTLTRLHEASVGEALAARPPCGAGSVRIGITGVPGAGKSTLIARLAKRLLERGREVGVLAIDPTSPLSMGSLLGDRIRMDAVADEPGLFIRSLPSRGAYDGLSDNTADLLCAMESHGFDDVLLETVGVGQAQYAVRMLVDTVVLVLHPESGDTVQAMKAGILEVADVLVINKSDLAGAKRMQAELQLLLSARTPAPGEWRPPVVLTSSGDETSAARLLDAIDAHLRWTRQRLDEDAVRRRRARHHVHSLVSRRVGEVVAALGDAGLDLPIEALYRTVVERLQEPG